MRISAFNPLVLTPKAEETIALFESLGFERRHTKKGIEGEVTSVSMKDSNGFRVDVAQVSKFPQSVVAYRMSVDNFEEAYEFLTSRGFRNPQGDRVTDTGSSHAALLFSPSGFAISLSQHIKE